MLDRRVEITGPTDRKMVINALNCGASTFMADFEDANCPTWDNMIDGQINLARRRAPHDHASSRTASSYRLNDKTAVLILRPRGWHLDEKHVHDRRQAGVRRDLRLRAALLPQREGAARARLGPVLLPAEDGDRTSRRGCGTTSSSLAQERARHPARHDPGDRADRDACSPRSRWTRSCGSCKRPLAPASTSGAGTTSSPASRSSASNQDFCLADRAQVTMTAPFMRAYALLLVKTCHRRNAPAMGGMAAQIPIKNDPAANEAALEKVRARTSCAKSPTAATAPGSRTRRWCRSRRRCSTSTCRRRTSTARQRPT